MTSRFPKTDWIFVAAIGLLLQGIWLIYLDQPSYMDAYYYTTNGQRLADGHGFTELVIWQYLDDPAGLPAPSHTYWMPLPSVLAGIGYLISDTFIGPQLIFWFLGGLIPLMAFSISQQLSGERWQAWAAALLTATGSFYGAFLSQPTTFAPFAWSAAMGLFTLGLISATQYRKKGGYLSANIKVNPALLWLTAGICAGLANLTRADGILMLVVALCIWGYGMVTWNRAAEQLGDGEKPNTIKTSITAYIGYLLILAAGYLVIMGPWLLRNLAVIGRPFSSVSLQTIFLTTYDDLFAYGREVDLSSYLEWGMVNIAQSKLESLWVAIQTSAAVPGFIFITPFTLIALVKLLKEPAKRAFLRPLVWFTVLLIFTMSMVFTFPGMRGAIFHSSSAIWPWSMALGAYGIGVAVDWAASRLRHWEPAKAKIRFSILFIFLALILGFYVSLSRAESDLDRGVMEQVRDYLPTNAVVMAGNAPGVHYHTGLPALSLPNEPAEIVYEAAQRYGVTHLMLDKDTPAPLRGLYSGQDNYSYFLYMQPVEDIKLYEVAIPVQ